MTLNEIECLTQKYSDAREDLSQIVATLTAQIEGLKTRALPLIKKKLALAAERQAHLRNAIEGNPELFEKPRTVIFHDIKVGLRKGAGGVDWDDDARVVKLIRQHFPKAQADLLIKITEKPIAKALQDLDLAAIKAIGCTVEGTGDVVVISPTNSEVDRVVSALLKGAVDEAGREAHG